jgi:GR25 family glycosyltransferase involved in LPS biosynthesis
MNKLENFGPVYLINLKDHTARLANAKKHFQRYKVNDYTIIEAIDGRKNDLSGMIFGKYPNLQPSEIGCIASHIKALNHWLETSDSEYAIIMEDDFSFDTVKYWTWNWEDVVNNIPRDADIVQMIMIKNDPIKFNMHRKEPFEKNKIMSYSWSTACYLIKRKYAKKLVSLHYVRGRYKLDNYGFENQAADVVLYNLGKAYSMPLFTHILDAKNSINQKHEHFHSKSKKNIDSWWKTNSHLYSKQDFFDLKLNLTNNKKEMLGCFTIFHDNNSSNSKRNKLTKKATWQLEKDFDVLNTPTIITRTPKEVKEAYKKINIRISPLGHFGTGWKPGELGIWASNWTAWKNFLKSNYDFIILMEDDIVLNNNFNEKLIEYISELPDDWDIFTAYIPDSGNSRYEKRKNDLLIGKENICKVYQSWSCLCYVVSKSGAKKLLKEVQRRVKSPLDHYLFYHKGLKVYTIKMEKENICNLYEMKSTVQEHERFDMTGYI